MRFSPACPEDAELGVAGGAPEGLHLTICDGTADTLAPLIHAVSRLEDDYSATFVLSLKHARAELTETHPLRLALVDLDSHARIFGTTDSCWWLLARFLAYAAPPDLDEPTLNARELALFTSYVFDPGERTLRAELNAFKSEVGEVILNR